MKQFIELASVALLSYTAWRIALGLVQEWLGYMREYGYFLM